METVAQRQGAASQSSAPLTLGAVGAGIAGSVLAAVAAALHDELVRYFLLWAALAGISGILAASSEHGNKAATWGLRLSVLLLGGNLLVARLVYDVRPLSLVIGVPLAVVAVLAPLMAVRVQSGQISIKQYLLRVGMAPIVVTAVLLAVIAAAMGGKMESTMWFGLTFAAPFGPLATLAAYLLAIPNAGEFFSLPLALAFTLAFGSILYVVVSRPQKAAYFLLPAAWLWIGWLVVGAGQILSCLE